MLLSSFRVSVETLRGNPLRTFLSTLGIVIGVASLVAVLSLADGMDAYTRSRIGATTDLHSINIAPRLSRQVDGVSVPVDSIIELTVADAAAIRGALGVPASVGLSTMGPTVSTVDATPRVVEVLGMMASLQAAQGVVIASGRAFADADTVARVAMLSRKASQVLAPRALGRPLAVGDSVQLGAHRLAVVAMLGGPKTDARVAAVVPIATARLFARPGARWAPAMTVHVDRVDDAPAAQAAVERWLATRYGPSWKSRAYIASRSEMQRQAREGLLVFKLLMGAITGICLLVGGIGVMNVLLASVIERTREIGVRRAVGAARRDILLQFLAESVTISSVGSVVGVALGLAGSYGITAVLRARTEAPIHAGFSVSTIAVAALATVVVGLTFGIYPALTASRLSPIDAIRHE